MKPQNSKKKGWTLDYEDFHIDQNLLSCDTNENGLINAFLTNPLRREWLLLRT